MFHWMMGWKSNVIADLKFSVAMDWTISQLISVFQRNHTQHNDTQHNDIQHNATQHNATQHNDIQHTDTQHEGIICDFIINNSQHK
jgi:hypothetical protein